MARRSFPTLDMMVIGLRIATGILVAPLALAVVWTMPYVEHSAFAKWAVINTVLAYGTFSVTAAVSHVVLKVLRLERAWHYCSVMFCVAFLGYVAFAFYGLRGYSELYYAQTKVIENGSLTMSGFVLQLTQAAQGAALLSAAFLLFWFIAVHERSASNNHA